MARRPIVAVIAGLVVALAAGGPASPAGIADAADAEASVDLPAAAISLVDRVQVRVAPLAEARRIKTMKDLRYDYRPTIFQLIARQRNGSGEDWFQIHVPGRPNGRLGWVPAASMDVLYSVSETRIEIDRSKRRLRLIGPGGRTQLKAAVAVGTRKAPTPLGKFYVTAAFRPGDRFLGPWAFETSAYAAITDWPRGGVVGLHGTSVPRSIGKRASHGCLRVFNRKILRLRKRVPLGTPIVIRA